MKKEGDENWTWTDSRSRAILESLLRKGEVPLTSEEMKPQDVFLFHPMFGKELKYKLWSQRLRSLRLKIASEKKIGEEAMKGLHHDRHLYPRTTHDLQGRLHWQGSDAERELKAYIASTFVSTTINGKKLRSHDPNRMMGPKALWLSSESYQMYDYKRFYKHVYQEIKTQKYYNYRNGKKGAWAPPSEDDSTSSDDEH
jgi:hypothetical protein